MIEAFIYDAIRTPRGKGKKDGSLYEVKPLNLLAGVLTELQRRDFFFREAAKSVAKEFVLGAEEAVFYHGFSLRGQRKMIYAKRLLCEMNRMAALTEKEVRVNGHADTPNMHDILTGSQPDGTAFPSGTDTTCGNWTKSGEGAAQVGHHDRWGLRDNEPSRSWNSSHPSRGCSQDNLRSSGGAGMLYCFAAK